LEEAIAFLSAAGSGFDKSLLRECLKSGSRTNGSLLVEALVHPNLQDDASFTTLCHIAVRWDVIDGAFYAALMSASLKLDYVDTLQRFLEKVVFADDTEFCSVAIVRRIPNLAPSTIESIYDALESELIDSRQESIAAVVELILRFEHLGLPDTAVMGMSNIMTLTRWLVSSSASSSAEAASSGSASSHAEALLTVLRDSHFLRFFAGICAPNEPLMLPPGGEATAKLIPHQPPRSSTAIEGPSAWQPVESSWRDKLPQRSHRGVTVLDEDPSSTPSPAGLVLSRLHSMVRGLESDWKRRRRDHLLDELYGFFCVGITAGDSRVIVEFLKHPDMVNFFSTFCE
jgi:hypothetical protein